jgi:transposase-like protein
LDVSAEISHLTNNGDNMDADGEQGCRPPSAYHRPQRTGVRSCKYLNSVVEQDHRRIKQRIRPMLGLKRFETAAVTIRGIPNGRENQKTTFNLKPVTGEATTAPEIWAAVLAA